MELAGVLGVCGGVAVDPGGCDDEVEGWDGSKPGGGPRGVYEGELPGFLDGVNEEVGLDNGRITGFASKLGGNGCMRFTGQY